MREYKIVATLKNKDEDVILTDDEDRFNLLFALLKKSGRYASVHGYLNSQVIRSS